MIYSISALGTIPVEQPGEIVPYATITEKNGLSFYRKSAPGVIPVEQPRKIVPYATITERNELSFYRKPSPEAIPVEQSRRIVLYATDSGNIGLLIYSTIMIWKGQRQIKYEGFISYHT